MAAYGGLVSLMNLMDQIQLYHARFPIFVDHQQTQLVTLHKRVVFMQNFLESYSHGARSEEVDGLENRIADVVYAAEDLIESYIVDDIHARSSNTRMKDFDDHFSRGLVKVVQDMDVIQQEAVKIDENTRLDDKQARVLTSSSSCVPPTTKDHVVAFDESLVKQIKEKLTEQQHNLQIIPITGMGGIGKTTLARHLYNSPMFEQMFDVRGWITISQEFNPREILFVLLRGMGDVDENPDEKLEYHELGDKLHKHLTGRRYLIVMDDIWSLEAWDKVRIFLPDSGKGSRVMITTRQSNLANKICCSNTYEMNLLDENESWILLLKKVFVQGSYPRELEEISKSIARKCNGLPLSISVIAGVLAKSMERSYWENVAEDISASVNSEEDGRYLRVLYTSYRYLPIHLKPCFLYFGVFPEDHGIRVSQLKKLWVAEGFLKLEEGKTLEEVAICYLKDLVDRNLIIVDKFGSTGNVKICKIHDLLRDLCLREAKRHSFLYVAKVHNLEGSQAFNNERRISLYSSKSTEVYSPLLHDALQSSPFIRSFLCNFKFHKNPSFDVKLLRVWSQERSCHTEFFM